MFVSRIITSPDELRQWIVDVFRARVAMLTPSDAIKTRIEKASTSAGMKSVDDRALYPCVVTCGFRFDGDGALMIDIAAVPFEDFSGIQAKKASEKTSEKTHLYDTRVSLYLRPDSMRKPADLVFLRSTMIIVEAMSHEHAEYRASAAVTAGKIEYFAPFNVDAHKERLFVRCKSKKIEIAADAEWPRADIPLDMVL